MCVCRYPKCERYRIQNFFPIPNFFDTKSDTSPIIDMSSRPERTIETILSFDQLSWTIENH